MPGITIDDLPLYNDLNVETEEIVLEIEQKTITPETERSRKISLFNLMKEGAGGITGDGLINENGLINVDNTVVRTTGDQTIAGIKTFSSNPISSAAQSADANSLTRRDFVTGLDDANVKLTGDQTIAGIKTFSTQIRIPTSTPGSLGDGAIWVV